MLFTTMLKRLMLFLVIGVLFAAVPGTAIAQRDPFDPLVEEEQAGLPDGFLPSEGAIEPEPAAPSPAQPALPKTGADADLLLPVSLLLIAAGSAALFLDRYRRLA